MIDDGSSYAAGLNAAASFKSYNGSYTFNVDIANGEASFEANDSNGNSLQLANGTYALNITGQQLWNPMAQPTGTTAGQVYFDSGANEPYYFDGVSWNPMAGGGGPGLWAYQSSSPGGIYNAGYGIGELIFLGTNVDDGSGSTLQVSSYGSNFALSVNGPAAGTITQGSQSGSFQLDGYPGMTVTAAQFYASDSMTGENYNATFSQLGTGAAHLSDSGASGTATFCNNRNVMTLVDATSSGTTADYGQGQGFNASYNGNQFVGGVGTPTAGLTAGDSNTNEFLACDGVYAINSTGPIKVQGLLTGAGPPGTILTNFQLYVNTITGAVFVN